MKIRKSAIHRILNTLAFLVMFYIWVIDRAERRIELDAMDYRISNNSDQIFEIKSNYP